MLLVLSAKEVFQVWSMRRRRIISSVTEAHTQAQTTLSNGSRRAR